MAQVSNVPSSDVELTCSSETKAPVSKPVIITVVEGCQTESSKPIDCKELLRTTASQSEVDLASKRAPKVPENSTDKSGSEGNNPFIREKVVVDGYNWRKYGQKLVKGNEFVRSYYRCTHPNCKAKKQLERSPGEHIVETVYFGEHDHPKPLASPVLINQDKRSDVLRATSKDNSSGSSVQTHSQTEPPKIHGGLHVSVIPPTDDVKTDVSESSMIKGGNTPKYYHSPAFKRRKKEVIFEQTPMERSTNESRTVVQTQTVFDVVNDGYRWRKYGQKSVKASPYPRSYYRCSSSGCPVKKHVERSTHDAKLLITTYEGKHDHDIPPGRVVTPNNLQNSEVDDKELSPKEGDDKKTPLSSALQSIKKDQHVEDRSRIKPETNGLEKRHDHGLVLDEKLKETTKDRSDVNKDHTANHAKSDDKTTASEIKSDAKTTASQEKGVRTLESQEQKLMPETSQS